jgi:uncharacterized membrane-anchored protein YhcB (DUF1043 family)
MKKNIYKFRNIEISLLYDKIAFIGSMPLPVTNIAKGLKELEDSMGSLGKSIENIQKEIQKKFLVVQEVIKKIPEDLKKIQKYLAEKSWYISLDLPIDLSRKIADLIVEGKDNEVEKAMQDYARLRVANVKEKVIKLYPQRRKILEDAFLAHQKKLYSLSIPTFLIQVEGISKEILGVSLYAKKNNIPKTKNKLVERINKMKIGNIVIDLDSYTDILFEYFRSPTGININTEKQKNVKKKRDNCSVEYLNRHSVLHGENLNYAIEVNSLRAILIFDFLICVQESFIELEKREMLIKKSLN